MEKSSKCDRCNPKYGVKEIINGYETDLSE